MNDYSKEYIRYYNNLKHKAFGQKRTANMDIALKDKIENSTADIYPTMRNLQSRNYQRGSYGYNRNEYNSVITTNKIVGYINRFIIRLVSTAMLLLIVLSLKVIPNDNVKKIYTYSKEYVSKDFNYDDFSNLATLINSENSKEIARIVEMIGKKINDFILILKEKGDSINDINLNGNEVDTIEPIKNNSTNE